ncbi:MAG: hypothetical protein ABWZ16_10065 [Microbacterium sp.]
MTMQLNHTATTDEHRRTQAAVDAAHLARRHAERLLRRGEIERDQAARALELNLPPRDEQERQQLRVAYADAAASVAVQREAFERAVAIENAATVLAAALDELPMAEIADDLLQLLEQRQRTRREVVPITARSRRTSSDARTTLR